MKWGCKKVENGGVSFCKSGHFLNAGCIMYSISTFILHFTYLGAVVKVDRRIRWHYTTTILRLRIGARLTRYRNYKFHNFARTISRHADGISRHSVPPSAGPFLPLFGGYVRTQRTPCLRPVNLFFPRQKSG